MRADLRYALERIRRLVEWSRAKLPPGVRTLVGLILVVLGFFGFLPILGFWMIPLGLVLMAFDIPPLGRRLDAWLARKRLEDEEEGRL